MARLQILELPGGSDDRPSFVLVIDQADGDLLADLAPTDADGHERSRSAHLAEQLGARAVLCFHGTIEIPANDTTAYTGGAAAESLPGGGIEENGPRCRYCGADCSDGRSWDGGDLYACGSCADWRAKLSQHKAALTDVLGMDRTRDWDDIRNAAAGLRKERETQARVIERVRNLPTEPELMNSEQEHPNIWLHGYKCGVLAAKAATRLRDEETRKP
jgi:hypothetical protein